MMDRSSETSAYSPDALDVSVYEQTFVFPHDISAITMTTTQFGITAKNVIGAPLLPHALPPCSNAYALAVANRNGQIQTYTRRMLDPRRPKRKTTAEEQEEWLVQYDALLPDDTRSVLSHNYHVRPPSTFL